MYISFAYPHYLYFLFAIPFLIFFHFYGLKNIKGKSLKFANFDAIARVKGIDFYSKNILLLLFNVLFVIVLAFSLAGLTLHKEMSISKFSFVIAIDNSRSMGATDLEPNRMAAAKETAKGFIDNLPYESYVGIVSFSGNAYTEQELTKNKQSPKEAIDGIEMSTFGGTDIHEAVIHSMNLMHDKDYKAVLLLSDGQINVGNLQETISYATEKKVVVHAFGIGTEEGGAVSYGLSKLDKDSLMAISYNTGGQYYSIDTKEELEQAFKEIIQIDKGLGEIDLSFYLIMIAIVLFIVKQFLISINRIIW